MMTIKTFGGVAGLLLTLSVSSIEAASPAFVNVGTLTNVPQVDAVTFANHGLFSVGTTLPYETQNTLNFTNTGVMTGRPGFRLENITSGGVRRPAASFYNGFDARVSARGFGFLSGGVFFEGSTFTGIGGSPKLLISATNVFSRGHLHADGSGLVQVRGQFVDVGRSSVGILPLTAGRGFQSPTNFFPDIGMTDRYWGLNGDGSDAFDVTGLVQPGPPPTNFAVRTPTHTVTNSSGFGFPVSLSLTNAAAFVVTNAVTPTNWVIQAVFVQVADPELNVDVRFSPSTIATNPYQTAVVEFSNLETNVLEGSEFLTTIYILDRMASETNFVLLTNLVTMNTFRPSTYEVTRSTPPEFLSGGPADPAASTNAAEIIFNSGYTNTVVTNIYAAYGFNVTNISSAPPPIPGASLLDLPGRVELSGDILNINRTRLRAEGIISLSTPNLVGTNAVLDAQNLALDLGTLSGNLRIENLVQDFVERTAGDIRCWSAMWTNQSTLIAPTGNQIPDPADPMAMIDEIATNTIDIGFHVFVVDSSQVITRLPVQTARFAARSGNVVIGDTLQIVESMFIDATNLVVTSTGDITLGPDAPDWNSVNVPNLLNLVNEGSIVISDTAFLGTNRFRPYASVVNRGTIGAYALSIRADMFENSGMIVTDPGSFFSLGTGTIGIEARTVRLDGGALIAPGAIRIGATDLMMEEATIESDQPVVLVITNSVADGGLPDGNAIVSEGFHLLQRPLAGDFLGTVFESSGPPFLEVMHTWAGEDRGPTASGFVNNATIGHLILNGQTDTLFRFRGARPFGNALYVEFLELQGNVPFDVASSIFVDPNMVIYFADSNVPADQLNGLFADTFAPEGRLRWVPSFAGANSSAQVMLESENRLVSMNRSLRQSATIDTDGDGIVNRDDPFPLDANATGRIGVNGIAYDKQTGTLSFSWDAQPGQAYVVEFSSSLTSPNWQVLSQHSNSGAAISAIRAQDRVPPDATQRYYRVRPVGAPNQ